MSIFHEPTKFFWRCRCATRNVKYFTFEACSFCDMKRDVTRTVPLGEVMLRCPNYSALIIDDHLTMIAKEFDFLKVLVGSIYGEAEVDIIDKYEQRLIYNNGDTVYELLTLSKLAQRIKQ